MSLNILLSSLYCPNSNLLDHYGEKEQVCFFFLNSQHGPNHPTYLHIVIGLVGSQSCRLSWLQGFVGVLCNSSLLMWNSSCSVNFCLTISRSWSCCFACTFPICSTGLFVPLLSVQSPVSSLLSLTKSTAEGRVQGQGEQAKDFLLKSSTSKADSPSYTTKVLYVLSKLFWKLLP